MPAFPDSLPAFTAEYLDDVLRSASLIDTAKVASVRAVELGHGKMGDNARIFIEYDGDQGDAPASVVAKLPAQDPKAREAAGQGGSYAREVLFYQQLADRTDMQTPTIYRSELGADGTTFLLVMADLEPAAPDNQTDGASRDHATSAVREATRLATSFRNDESLLELEFVQQPGRDFEAGMTQDLLVQFWPSFLGRFEGVISPECKAFGDLYINNHKKWAQGKSGDFTLAHGDFRSENILFGDGGSATTVDWQTLGLGSLFTDMAYYCGGSLDTEDRRAWERELVEEARSQFAQNGVTLSVEEAWELYREEAIHGLMITILGASFSSPDPRGDAMFTAMIQRHLQHCVDLDSESFLG